MEYQKFNIIDHDMDGKGVAKQNGKVFFVEGGIAGEEVLAETQKQNKNFGFCTAKKILTPSPSRQMPPCKYFGVCGGCTLLHIKEQKQLEIKQKNVQNLFQKAKLDCTSLKPVYAEDFFEYRNKITLFWSQNKLGFFEKGSRKIVPIKKCLLASQNMNKMIEILGSFFALHKEFCALKSVSLREINKRFVINLVLGKKIELGGLAKHLEAEGVEFALYFCINSTKNSILPVYPCTFAFGKEILALEQGIKYPVFPMSFLQVNNKIKAVIYEQILRQIDKNQIVVDAYSGAGLLSAIMAKKCAKVFAVEIDKSASLASQILAKNNKILNMESICGDCAVVLPKIFQQKVDVLVLDPSRKGVDAQILHQAINCNIQKIVYLSCNPATLCRDLKILCEGGFQIESIRPYDMFPNTPEIEVLTILTKTSRKND